MTIALFDTHSALESLREEILAAIGAAVERGAFILGPEVEAFEREFAAYLGVRHVVGVANGTDAIMIALRAVGVRPGDDVVVPSLTFYASAEAIAAIGARPVFCDVDVGTRNLTADTVRAAITANTTAIVAVDLFGVPAPSLELREFGVAVVEDAAQAAGARLGTRRAGALGDVATFSFYPSKNLACLGDGGAIATDDDSIAELARALRFHGSRDKQTFEHVGYNSRLDEIQAAVLRVMLEHLDRWCNGRRNAGSAYLRSGLGDRVGLPVIPDGADPAWHLFVVTHPRADELIGALGEAGIQSRGYYRTPLHRQAAMAPYVGGARLPATEALARTIMALPISPFITESDVGAVTAALAAAL
jgi:dTDP-3-amino-3,4,6-trideoxy-alpha-D-glucose transaminase